MMTMVFELVALRPEAWVHELIDDQYSTISECRSIIRKRIEERQKGCEKEAGNTIQSASHTGVVMVTTAKPFNPSPYR